MNNSLTDVAGLKVGHWTDAEAATGCTVVLCPQGVVAGVDVRGGAPGTRETDLLDPTCLVEQVHAIVLSGGSAFGLAAADGVMQWLEERGYGFPVGNFAKIPLVPSAIIFDLGIGNAKVRPTARAGYAACEAATDGPVAQGNIGAGMGATVGKRLGMKGAMKGGLGSASQQLNQGLVVAALVVVNAVGDVRDFRTGRMIAGARKLDGSGFAFEVGAASWAMQSPELANTTIAVVATNASLTKAQMTKVAQMAHDGLARVIYPIHTPSDGDTIFALSLGEQKADVAQVGALAAELMADAVLNGVMAAEATQGVPAARDVLRANVSA